MALSDYQTIVESMVRDESETLSSSARDTGIVFAVAKYSADRPRIVDDEQLPHLLDDENDTIPAGDREAVCCWAAAYCFDQLAAKHSGDVDASIQAAQVNRATPAQEYATRAKDHRKRYFVLMGQGADGSSNDAAGVTVHLGCPERLL
jgi:hypothetical protein